MLDKGWSETGPWKSAWCPNLIHRLLGPVASIDPYSSSRVAFCMEQIFDSWLTRLLSSGNFLFTFASSVGNFGPQDWKPFLNKLANLKFQNWGCFGKGWHPLSSNRHTLIKHSSSRVAFCMEQNRRPVECCHALDPVAALSVGCKKILLTKFLSCFYIHIFDSIQKPGRIY